MVEQQLELSRFLYNANLAFISDFLLWLAINISTVYVKSLITWFTLYFVFPVTEFSLVIYYVASQVNIWHKTQNEDKQNKTNTTKNIKKISNTNLTETRVLSKGKQYRIL